MARGILELMVKQSSIIKVFLSFWIILFFMSAFLGVSHAGMKMDADDQMSDCPFTSGVSVCTMTPFEHLMVVQSIYQSLPAKNDIALFLVFLFISIGIISSLQKVFDIPQLRLTYSRYGQWELFGLFPKQEFTNWLALHENSPSLA